MRIITEKALYTLYIKISKFERIVSFERPYSKFLMHLLVNSEFSMPLFSFKSSVLLISLSREISLDDFQLDSAIRTLQCNSFIPTRSDIP